MVDSAQEELAEVKLVQRAPSWEAKGAEEFIRDVRVETEFSNRRLQELQGFGDMLVCNKQRT